MATYSAWQATIQNEFGDILPGAEITVVNESTGLPATIYSGRTGGTLTNPFFADVNGFAQFYAESSEYRITALDGGSGFTNTWRYVEIGALLSIDEVESRITGKNYLINANLNTTIINQRGFGGGQPAAGVYGYDRWKGDTLGTRIEQVVENTEAINETFTISWVGGTGTADVDSVTGLNSGDSFTLNTATNFSVIVPADATYIMLNKGSFVAPFPDIDNGLELAKCQRYYWQGLPIAQINYGAYASGAYWTSSFGLPVTMRSAPTLTNALVGSASSNIDLAFGADGLDAQQSTPNGFKLISRSSATSTNCFSTYSGYVAADSEL